MKRLIFALGITVCLVIGGFAYAGGADRQCSVTFTSGAAGITSSPSAGTCAWENGATVLMQCDQDVYFTASGTATSADFVVKFTVNPDPYLVDLQAGSFPGGGSSVTNQKNISVLGVTASGTCKFSKSLRRRPM